MYQLIFSDRYVLDLERLEDPAGAIEKRLKAAVYWALENNPTVGLPLLSVERAMVIRVWIVKPLMGVRVLYRIDEGARTVTLLALQQFSQADPFDFEDPFEDE
jgi:mRNA-degrading endonuclease RelE of RelBE toxin-antitoxin system